MVSALAVEESTSRWAMQTRTGGPYVPVEEQGDCLAACVASILAVPVEVIDFPLGDDWWDRLHEKLAVYGYCIANVKIDAAAPRGLWIATVPSLNLIPKPGDKQILHCVVARDNELVHDPCKSQRYDDQAWAELWNAEKIIEGWALAAIDPGACSSSQ